MANQREHKSTWTDRDDTLQVARFHVGDEEYALDIMRIKEIINPIAVTRVPRAPAFIEGVIELRGTFMAVIDLRKRLGLAATPQGRDSKYIVVRMDDQVVALIVDRVIDVQRMARRDIRSAPEAIVQPDHHSKSDQDHENPPGHPGTPLVAGVVKHEGRIVLILDLDAVLSPTERSALGALETTA